MNAWKWAACCAACLGLAGCRTPQTITALERECRMLEDQLYALEDELARAEQALEACQASEPGAARRAGGAGRGAGEGAAFPSLRGPQLTPNGSARPPVDPRSLRLPDVEMPGQPLPSGELPKTLAPSTPEIPLDKSSLPSLTPGAAEPPRPNGSPEAQPAFPKRPTSRRAPPHYHRPPAPRAYAGRTPAPKRTVTPPSLMPAEGAANSGPRAPQRDGSMVAARKSGPPPSASTADPKMVDTRVVQAQAIALDPRADNTRVDRITLNRVLTGGYERDARFGDAGLSVLVEPRDAQGRIVASSGPISVVVLDRGLSGDAARVARWDFTTEQTASLFHNTPHGEGFYLEMPWPGLPPAHSHLHVFVRYATKDGRNLEASREIDISLPPQREQGWRTVSLPSKEPESRIAAWQQRPGRDEDSPVQPAVAEEPAASEPAGSPQPSAAVANASGGGPRHATWSPNRR